LFVTRSVLLAGLRKGLRKGLQAGRSVSIRRLENHQIVDDVHAFSDAAGKRLGPSEQPENSDASIPHADRTASRTGGVHSSPATLTTSA
jgi:hypothetical protein